MTDWLAARLPPQRLGLIGWLRALSRGAAIALIVYGGLLVLALLRLGEWPLYRGARPLTPQVTHLVCRLVLRVMRLPVTLHGQPMTTSGAMVANHAGWLDIFVLNAATPVMFVAKSEVAGWPGIGLLARATGTLFITRKAAEAKKQQSAIENRLLSGHRLLFFPEGTSSDAQRVLPFKSTLFAAFFAPGLAGRMHIQPLTVTYHAPPGQDPRFYGWWGDMDFAPHLLAVLALPRQGRVEVTFHPKVAVSSFASRKDLAQHCERAIRTAHTPGA